MPPFESRRFPSLATKLNLRLGRCRVLALDGDLLGAIEDTMLESVEFPSLSFKSVLGEFGETLGHSLLNHVTFVSEDIVPHSLTPSSGARLHLVDVVGDDGGECKRTVASPCLGLVGDLFVIITAPSAFVNSEPLRSVAAGH